MSRTNAKELRNLSPIELDQKRAALEKENFELRQKKITGTLEKPHLFKRVRRQIAQIATVKRETENAKRK